MTFSQNLTHLNRQFENNKDIEDLYLSPLKKKQTSGKKKLDILKKTILSHSSQYKGLRQENSLKQLKQNTFNLQDSSNVNLVSQILKKNHIERTLTENQILNLYFEKSEFYQFYQDEFQDKVLFDSVLKHLQYEQTPAFKPIIRSGSQGQNIYILLSGKAHKLIKNNTILQKQQATYMQRNQDGQQNSNNNNNKIKDLKEQDNIQINEEINLDSENLDQGFKNEDDNNKNNKDENQQKKTNNNYENQQKKTNINNDDENQQKKTKNHNSQQQKDELSDLELIQQLHPEAYIFKTINLLGYFGDISIRHRAKKQSSVVPETFCKWAILPFEAYHKLIGRNCKIFNIIKELKQSSILKQFPNNVVESIYRNCEQKNYITNQQIYKEGQQSNNVYYIREGEIELSKKLAFPQFFKQENQMDQPVMHKHADRAQFFMKKKQINLNSNNIISNVAILCQYQIFGLEDIFKRYRDYSATSKSHMCHLFIIPADIFVEISYQFLDFKSRNMIFIQNQQRKHRQQLSLQFQQQASSPLFEQMGQIFSQLKNVKEKQNSDKNFTPLTKYKLQEQYTKKHKNNNQQMRVTSKNNQSLHQIINESQLNNTSSMFNNLKSIEATQQQFNVFAESQLRHSKGVYKSRIKKDYLLNECNKANVDSQIKKNKYYLGQTDENNINIRARLLIQNIQSNQKSYSELNNKDHIHNSFGLKTEWNNSNLFKDKSENNFRNTLLIQKSLKLDILYPDSDQAQEVKNLLKTINFKFNLEKNENKINLKRIRSTTQIQPKDIIKTFEEKIKELKFQGSQYHNNKIYTDYNFSYNDNKFFRDYIKNNNNINNNII